MRCGRRRRRSPGRIGRGCSQGELFADRGGNGGEGVVVDGKVDAGERLTDLLGKAGLGPTSRGERDLHSTRLEGCDRLELATFGLFLSGHVVN